MKGAVSQLFTPTVKFSTSTTTLKQLQDPTLALSPYNQVTPILRNSKAAACPERQSEPMEMSENYQDRTEALEYTASYNDILRQKAPAPPQLAASLGSSALLKSQQTINLNTFNQQKRILRLLQSCTGKDVSANPRPMKDPPSTFLRDILEHGPVQEISQHQIGQLRQDNDNFARSIRLVTEAAASLDEFLASHDCQEVALASSQKTQKIVKTHFKQFANSLFPDFAVAYTHQQISLSYNTSSGLSIFRVTIGARPKALRSTVFGVQIAFNCIFENISAQLLEIVPETYRFGSPRFQAKRDMQIFAPLLSSRRQVFSAPYDLGDFLFSDFLEFQREVLAKVSNFRSLAEKLQLNPGVICYIGCGKLILRSHARCREVQDLVSFEGRCCETGDLVCGVDGVLGN
uniref:Uncharacterized protein n=1 Tax=Spironucleus salmonicida TaxID=348837 RepID=V6M3R9_9EUKA|eukprot:EST47949.1 Hypothetical protein SS50377_11932 [Spironucleus salmonicida]